VDVSAGEVVADAIRALGFDTLSVRDVDPRMSDVDILNWAVADQRFLVTLDKDFGELVFHSGLPHAGVLLMRLDDGGKAMKHAVTTAIFTMYAAQLSGRYAVYRKGRLRIR
jgi:predicted nuclease of predicted toxin-antitoxin system